MSVPVQLALYSLAIVASAIGGAVLPLLRSDRSLVTFLAFAAGVMFGAVFFHMLPEAMHSGGYRAFTWVPVGFFFLLVLERYVLVHVCEEPPDCQEHGHQSGGLAAFLGLSVHT